MSLRRVELTDAASVDIADLLDRSVETFGAAARDRYESLLAIALEDIATDPLRPTSKALTRFGDDVRAYHLRHSRSRSKGRVGIVRTPRHVLVYRVLLPTHVRIIRVLHDSMRMDLHISQAIVDQNGE